MSCLHLIAKSVRPAVAVVALSVFAGSIAEAGLFQGYNLIVQGDLEANQHVDGAAWVGNNLSTNGTWAGWYSHAPDANGNTLVVGGDISGNHTVDNGGKVIYTGNQSGGFNLNAGATKTQVSSALTDIAGFWSDLVSASQSYSAITANSSTSIQSGNLLVFDAAPDASGLAVFDVASSIFSTAGVGQMDLNMNGASTILINVTGDLSAFSLNSYSSFQNNASKILWNFADAETLNIGPMLHGSILGTEATLTNSNQLQGSVAVKNMVMNGEVHFPLFDGDIPLTPVPEPASLLFLGTFGVLSGLFLRRRR